MKKIRMTIFIMLLGSIFLLWFLFIKRDLVSSNHLKMCIDSSHKFVRIELMESAKFIANYSTDLNGDTLLARVYSTTIFNPFVDRKSSIQIDVSNVEYIVITDSTYFVSSLLNCQNMINNTILEK